MSKNVLLPTFRGLDVATRNALADAGIAYSCELQTYTAEELDALGITAERFAALREIHGVIRETQPFPECPRPTNLARAALALQRSDPSLVWWICQRFIALEAFKLPTRLAELTTSKPRLLAAKYGWRSEDFAVIDSTLRRAGFSLRSSPLHSLTVPPIPDADELALRQHALLGELSPGSFGRILGGPRRLDVRAHPRFTFAQLADFTDAELAVVVSESCHHPRLSEASQAEAVLVLKTALALGGYPRVNPLLSSLGRQGPDLPVRPHFARPFLNKPIIELDDHLDAPTIDRLLEANLWFVADVASRSRLALARESKLKLDQIDALSSIFENHGVTLAWDIAREPLTSVRLPDLAGLETAMASRRLTICASPISDLGLAAEIDALMLAELGPPCVTIGDLLEIGITPGSMPSATDRLALSDVLGGLGLWFGQRVPGPDARLFMAEQEQAVLRRNELLAGHPDRIFCSVRVRGALAAAGIGTVRQLVGWTRAEIGRLPNVAQKSLFEIVDVLGRYGLWLGMRDSQIGQFLAHVDPITRIPRLDEARLILDSFDIGRHTTERILLKLHELWASEQ